MMPPEQSWLPFFGQSEERSEPPSSESEPPKPEQVPKPKNPYVGEGLVGETAYETGLAYMRELRAKHPLFLDARIIKEACTKGELRGREWVTAFRWALRHGEVPPAKKLEPRIKTKSPETLRRFGGNRNADRMIPKDDR